MTMTAQIFRRGPLCQERTQRNAALLYVTISGTSVITKLKIFNCDSDPINHMFKINQCFLIVIRINPKFLRWFGPFFSL